MALAGCAPDRISVFCTLKLALRWHITFTRSQAHRIGGAHIDTVGAGETVGDHVFPFEDGVHNGGGACFGARFAGDTGVVVDLDPENADLFHKPADKAKGAKEVAPRSVDKQACGQQKENKAYTSCPQGSRFIDLEGIDKLDNVQ